jgi:hypothetical protein
LKREALLARGEEIRDAADEFRGWIFQMGDRWQAGQKGWRHLVGTHSLQAAGEILQQGVFVRFLRREGVSSGQLFIFALVRFELGVGRMKDPSLFFHLLFNKELNLRAGLRFPGSTSLVLRFGLDDLTGSLGGGCLTLPWCFCLTWVKRAA